MVLFAVLPSVSNILQRIITSYWVIWIDKGVSVRFKTFNNPIGICSVINVLIMARKC